MPRAGGKPLLAFTHIPKTAGTSVHHILRRTFGTGYAVVNTRGGDADVFSADDLRRLRRRYWGLQAFGGHSVVPHGDLVDAESGIRFMTLVRDPVVRTASHYAHRVRRGRGDEDLAAWISDERNQNVQTRRLSGAADAARAKAILDQLFDFVGVVERFEDSLGLLARLIPGVALPSTAPHRNRSPIREVRDEVLADAASVAVIEAGNPEDIELYRYVVEVVWPRQEAAASGIPIPTYRESRAWMRERLSYAKERVVLGIPRRLARAGLPIGKPL